jgi:hypothetical protein
MIIKKFFTPLFYFFSSIVELPDIRQVKLITPSVVVLLFTNFLPILGVIYFQWDLYSIMLLFWLETLIIAVLSLFKMLLCSPKDVWLWLKKPFIIIYLGIQYVFLIISCGLAISYLFGGDFYEIVNAPSLDLLSRYIQKYQLFGALVGLGVSRCFSLAVNYIGKGEYKQSTIRSLMYQPFGQIVVIEIVIIITGLIIKIAGAPLIGLILLIVIKIYLDMMSHLKLHSKSFKKDPEPVFEQD